MTQEEKQLVLKDLCEKLPYEVRVFVERDKYTQATLLGVNAKQFSIVFGGNGWSSTSNIEGHCIEQYKQLIKPYLRPLSSMTEEEWSRLYNSTDIHYDNTTVDWEASYKVTDWLNAHYFDYRGLIEKGLALEAPKDMYSI